MGNVAETTGEWALRGLRDRMRSDPEGARILRLRPRITVSQGDEENGEAGRWRECLLLLIVDEAYPDFSPLDNNMTSYDF